MINIKKVTQCTNQGDREYMQDVVLIKDNFFAVFDGLGGHQYGTEAATVAAQWFNKHTINRDNIHKVAEEASCAVVDMANTLEASVYRTPSTTVAALLIEKDHAYVYHVGDSFFLYTDSCNNMNIIEGEHQWPGGGLSSALGADRSPYPDFRFPTHSPQIEELILEPGKYTLIVATDGIQNTLVFQKPKFSMEAEEIIDMCLDRQIRGQDNIAVICVDIEVS